MSYSVYFKYGGKKYKLPVNPEEIKKSRELDIETYQVLNEGQVSIPAYCELEKYSFESEFPSNDYHYMEPGARADSDYYEKMFKKAQKNKKVIRFIASNDINDDISKLVLVKSVSAVEKAGEEGDKYLSFTFVEYKAPGKRYVAVQTAQGPVKKEDTTAAQTAANPAVTENKTHIVASGDTLWALAKLYYGNGALYPKIVSANPGIKNPNVISIGQSLVIPSA